MSPIPMDVSRSHEPVLVPETLAFLGNGPGLYLDATVGDGGHAWALLAREPGARMLATDRDLASLATARVRLAPYGDRVTFAHATFRELPAHHRALGSEPFAGAILDLGLSSRQIDDPGRGISFMAEGPLDLRMDPSRGRSAADRIAATDVATIADVVRRLGDVGPAPRLATAMVAAARQGRLASTRDLSNVVERVLGRHPRQKARVFQALRMWVNEEAEELEAVLQWLPGVMRARGVVVTLAYHSGEDRRIKRALRGLPEESPRRRPPSLHPVSAAGPWEELTRKVVVPSPEEIVANPRARSARLRAFRRRVS